jgi:ZIP family zinc transporter
VGRESRRADGEIALGLLAGSAVFFAAEVLIDHLGGSKPERPGGTDPGVAGRAITLGIILDGIPESLVLGLTVLEAGSVSTAFLVAVFIANLPEAIVGFALAFGISALD